MSWIVGALGALCLGVLSLVFRNLGVKSEQIQNLKSDVATQKKGAVTSVNKRREYEKLDAREAAHRLNNLK